MMKSEIAYTEKEGLLYPDLQVAEDEKAVIGRFGQAHKRYLKKHKKVMYINLLTSGKLKRYLLDIDRDAQEMFERIVNDIKEAQGITEELKAADMMRWVQEMNSIINMAEEFVMQEIVHR